MSFCLDASYADREAVGRAGFAGYSTSMRLWNAAIASSLMSSSKGITTLAERGARIADCLPSPLGMSLFLQAMAGVAVDRSWSCTRALIASVSAILSFLFFPWVAVCSVSRQMSPVVRAENNLLSAFGLDLCVWRRVEGFFMGFFSVRVVPR